MFGLFKKRKKTGVSKGGSTLYEYKETGREIGTRDMAAGDEANMEAITQHLEKYIGKIDFVYHEIISPLVHIDIHVIYPTAERNFFTLVTSGMSDRPMKIPDARLKGWEYGEVMICLPATWKMDEESFKDEKYYWPIRMMKFIARFPHEYNSWISYGHTIPNGNPPAPVADGVGFCGVLLEVPITMQDEEFHVLKINDNKHIRFYALLPLFEEEMNFKLEEGSEALLELFEKHRIFELIDVKRPNVAL